jgi:thiosulfate dehydrogenase (quinone) large subunit
MFTKWLKENTIAAGILTVLRLYVGWEFLHAGWGKLTAPEPFSALGFLKGAAASAVGEHPAVQSWWASFLNGFAIPNHGLFDFMVPYGEFLVGLGLILGCFTTVAVFFGMTLNFAFLFSGTTSTNPQLVLLSIFIIIAGANAGKFGLDRWVIPFIKKATLKQKDQINQHA